MSEEKKHIIYTAEDIKQYITGAMTPAEMHAIEMAALDDPLLAEAMEGYELMEQKDWSKELAALKQQFNKNEETPVVAIGKTSTFKWWKAAAAILVLGATATTAYIFTSKNKTETTRELAKLQPTISDSGTIAKNDSANTHINTLAADSSSQLIAKLGKLNSTGSTVITSQGTFSTYSFSPDTKQQTDSSFIYRPSADSVNYLAINERRADDASREKDYKTDVQATTASGNIASNNANAAESESVFKNKAEEGIITLDKKSNANNGAYYNASNSFNGLVVTPDNKPVGYANIKIPESKKPVYTDANGRFTFTAADTSLKVTVSSAGFSSQKFTLKNAAAQNKIVLQPQDVATQTIGAPRKLSGKKREQTVIDSSALDEDTGPAGGWVEYNNYLSSNLKFPDEAKQRNIHGEVEVTVKLKENGDISQVKIARPLSPECDAEAIRLVKEGPKWDVKGNKKTKVKVKVKF